MQAQVALQERHLEERAWWRSVQGPSGRVEVAPGVELTLRRGEVIEVSLAAHREPERERWQSLKASRYVPGSLHATDITPALWRRLELELERPDGSLAEVELIRPLWWLDQTGAAQGGTINLEVTEAGLAGRARVVSLSDDVTVDSRTAYGAIVTATIRHENASVIELVLEGDETDPLGVTPNHPLYSADRDAWVPAGEFEVGERVETQDGVTATVTSIRDEGRRETVYNLEVHRAQTYYVGEQKLLAHNTCAEIVLENVQDFNQARNKAFEIIGDIGPTVPLTGRLGKSAGFGKIVGRQSKDGLVRWRVDFDPKKGAHINVEDFRLGKGKDAVKYAIPFEGGEDAFKSALKRINR